jgi:RNA polymerase sigma-70 factor (ECF subfamily)
MASDPGGNAAVIDEKAGERAEERSTGDDDGEAQAREEVLVRRCIEGDGESFRPLVERYSPSLHSFVTRHVGPGDHTRDIVQEAFLRAFRALPDFNPRYRFSTWLFRIALNLCRDHLKKTRKRPRDLPLLAEDTRHGVDGRVEEKVDDRRRCEIALALMLELPAKYREPLMLKDVQRMDYKQMARVTGLNVGLLKIRVMRGRRKLASSMRARGLGPGRTEEDKKR